MTVTRRWRVRALVASAWSAWRADGSAVALSNANSASTGGAVAKVRQSVEPPVLSLDMDAGTTTEIALAEATSSVVLRSKDDTLEYAD